MKAGRFSIGIKRPQRNIIGNLKKFENVCASKTSLTETAINKPKKVEVKAINITPNKTKTQFIPDKSVKKEAKITGIKALTIPNKIAPVVLANINKFKLIGARSNLSKDLAFLSKVIVTANIEVVPNNIDKAITPGNMPLISILDVDLIKNIKVQDIGKIIPQLILGGFK